MMSDTNLKTNSSIELSDIRKLDILLTQCESSSCENICIDCCAKLGSVEDDDDDGDNANGENGSGADSLITNTTGAPKDLKGTLNCHSYIRFFFFSMFRLFVFSNWWVCHY